MPISLIVDGQPYSSPIRISGDGIKFAVLTFTATNAANQPFVIKTIDGLLPLDKAEGLLDGDGRATVYLGPTREKGDADLKIVVGSQTKIATARFF